MFWMVVKTSAEKFIAKPSFMAFIITDSCVEFLFASG